MRGLKCLCVACPFFVAIPAQGAGPIGANGSDLETSNYSLDLYLGSVVAGNRVTGMGGAYVAVAEDVDGNLQNPAAPAVRSFH